MRGGIFVMIGALVVFLLTLHVNGASNPTLPHVSLTVMNDTTTIGAGYMLHVQLTGDVNGYLVVSIDLGHRK